MDALRFKPLAAGYRGRRLLGIRAGRVVWRVETPAAIHYYYQHIKNTKASTPVSQYKIPSDSMHDENLSWRIEDACLKAWPALHETIVDGWLLRFAKGLTRRANSANPLRVARDESDALISTLETEYRKQKLPVYFRIPSIIGPTMPNGLARRGYKPEGESLVLYAGAQDTLVPTDAVRAEAAITDRPNEEWLSAIALLQEHSAQTNAVYRQIIDSIKVPAAFAALRQEGRIVSLAFGAIHDNLLCIESVVTDQACRGRGLARRMLGALIAYAQPKMAGICLQVQADNAAGLRLYSGFGLRELYRYHYQRKLFEE
jgi:ribosomal protein S18 acetylase RimI-like enzyme